VDVEGPFDWKEIDGRGKQTSEKERTIRATENFSRQLAPGGSCAGSLQKQFVRGAGRRGMYRGQLPVPGARILKGEDRNLCERAEPAC
jgi:hypothetical protein